MSNNEIRNSIFASRIADTNPIVEQLIEFGFDNIYSRRVFYYLHPMDIEEALNYMAEENGIIQHRFVQDRRNISNKMCYICGEERAIHLRELENSINGIQNSFEEEKEDKKENKETNSDLTQSKDNSNINHNEVQSSINYHRSISASHIRNESNNNMLSDETNFRNIKNHFNNNNNDLKKKEEKIECGICNELFIVNDDNRVSKCGHAFCPSCWYDFLSVKIKENKLPSIKCLDYECQEKLEDKFIINLLNSDINLIKKYKQYKLELDIINDPNKKLCPYPNCDSYLEKKEKLGKDVTCKNNHTFCFICLKKPHGKLPCNNENIDKSIVEYAVNNFVKKCPKCSIITEKNDGCNHITCTKCGYQWCWLCNQAYNIDHFNKGKCKGFQFFKPKNDYEIKLMLEGKIKVNELSLSQRQIDEDFMDMPRFRRRNDEERYNSRGCCEKIYKVCFFILFGNCLLIIASFDLGGLIAIIYIFLAISFLLQLIFLNIISFILILIFKGFKTFILELLEPGDKYVEQFILIIINILIGMFCIIYESWKNLIDRAIWSSYYRYFYKFLIFFPSFIMCNIILFPQHILINIIGEIIYLIDRGSFSSFFRGLDRNYNGAFNYSILND